MVKTLRIQNIFRTFATSYTQILTRKQVDRETYRIRGYRPRGLLWCQQQPPAHDKVAFPQTARRCQRQRHTAARGRGANGKGRRRHRDHAQACAEIQPTGRGGHTGHHQGKAAQGGRRKGRIGIQHIRQAHQEPRRKPAETGGTWCLPLARREQARHT